MTTLTPAEWRVLQRAATGETLEQTAAALGVERRTLYNQRSSAFGKLGVSGNIGAFLAVGWMPGEVDVPLGVARMRMARRLARVAAATHAWSEPGTRLRDWRGRFVVGPVAA